MSLQEEENLGPDTQEEGYITTKAEIGVMQLKGNGCQELVAITRTRKRLE